jgi:hypothetical protein
MPRDPLSGGTWIAANDSGVVSCLLNGNLRPRVNPASRKGLLSRGGLVPFFCLSASIEQSQEWAAGVTFARFEPFDLFQFFPESGVFRLSWDGGQWVTQQGLPEYGFFTGSSYDPDGVRASRSSAFDRLSDRLREPQSRREALLDFHRWRDGVAPAYGVDLLRQDAFTRSISILETGLRGVSWRYWERLEPSGTFEVPGHGLWIDRTKTGAYA